MITERIEEILSRHGWVVECESPLEIRHEESNSFATNEAARMVINKIHYDDFIQQQRTLREQENATRELMVEQMNRIKNA